MKKGTESRRKKEKDIYELRIRATIRSRVMLPARCGRTEEPNKPRNERETFHIPLGVCAPLRPHVEHEFL